MPISIFCRLRTIRKLQPNHGNLQILQFFQGACIAIPLCDKIVEDIEDEQNIEEDNLDLPTPKVDHKIGDKMKARKA